jgi:hypothetical protein
VCALQRCHRLGIGTLIGFPKRLIKIWTASLPRYFGGGQERAVPSFGQKRIAAGLTMSNAGPTFFIPGTIGKGIIAFTADTLIGPGPGADGSGTLAIVDFSSLKPGISSINLSNVILLNPSGNDISFSLSNGKVVVGNVSTVPEPQSLYLLFIGFCGIILVLRLQGQKSRRMRAYPLVAHR